MIRNYIMYKACIHDKNCLLYSTFTELGLVDFEQLYGFVLKCHFQNPAVHSENAHCVFTMHNGYFH